MDEWKLKLWQLAYRPVLTMLAICDEVGVAVIDTKPNHSIIFCVNHRLAQNFDSIWSEIVI